MSFVLRFARDPARLLRGRDPVGRRFCGSCGSALAAVCSTCGTTNPAGQRFCGRSKTYRLLELVDQMPQGLRPPLLEATAHRFRAHLAGNDPANG